MGINPRPFMWVILVGVVGAVVGNIQTGLIGAGIMLALILVWNLIAPHLQPRDPFGGL